MCCICYCYAAKDHCGGSRVIWSGPQARGAPQILAAVQCQIGAWQQGKALSHMLISPLCIFLRAVLPPIAEIVASLSKLLVDGTAVL